MSLLESMREAWFYIMRDGEQFSVQGKDLAEKTQDGDVFFVQRGDKQFKFTSKRIEFAWERALGWYHIKNVKDAEIQLWPRAGGGKTLMWDQDQNLVTRIEPGDKEYFVSVFNDQMELNTFQDNKDCTWDFGDRCDVSMIRDGRKFFRGCNKFNGNVDCFRDIPWRNMDEMFMGCTRFNQDISEWFGCGRMIDPRGFDRMFFGAAGFTQDLSDWCGLTLEGEDAPKDIYAGSGIENSADKQINMACRTNLYGFRGSPVEAPPPAEEAEQVLGMEPIDQFPEPPTFANLEELV